MTKQARGTSKKITAAEQRRLAKRGVNIFALVTHINGVPVAREDPDAVKVTVAEASKPAGRSDLTTWYNVDCTECGRVDIHPVRKTADLLAEQHKAFKH